ncbi:MAG TPA: VWA domain-containing protein, partial [Polyangiaceae bacterium]|nr:VWA domain-containing protein [Polyangiaceae bacterium]
MRARRIAFGVFLVALAAGLTHAYVTFVLRAPAGAFRFERGGETFELLAPEAFGVLLVLPLLLLGLARSLADLPWPQRVLSLVLRVAFLGLVALALASPVRTESTDRVATVVLVDVSDSVTDEALGTARKEIEAVLAARRADDLVRLVTFAERPRVVSIEREGETHVPSIAELRHARDPKSPSGSPGPGAATDVQAALQLAYGLFPPGYLKRALLFTDGVETSGDLLSEANRAQSFGVRLFARPYREPPPGEVSVVGLRLPDKVDIGQSFTVTAELYASRPTRARLRLFQGEALNGLDPMRELEVPGGRSEVEFKSVVRVGGEVTYALELEPQGPDAFRENNRFRATLDVPGRPLVLYVEGQPARASYLANALTAQQFDVDVRGPSAFPASLGEIERFDFVILSDTPREALGLGAHELVERYVRDLGGGFLFAGGPAGFGLGGWAHTTIERLLPVNMDAERQKEIPGVAMALVIDRSGSMTGLPMEMAKAACIATVGTLQGDDLVEVIAFDAEPVRYVKLQPVRYRSRIQADVQRIQPGGGTEIFPALDMAYQDLSVVQARKKHVILLTDGQSPAQGIRELAQAMIAESITLTTVGLGESVNIELLRGLADTGGGRFHHAPDPNALPRIFTRETEIVSQKAAVEEWFPVTQVSPADFLKGISVASAPLLHGYVSTQLKPPPAQLVLESDRGEPVLARWRAGLGWALAWTSDVKNGWAVEWLRWPNFGRFWGQLVREHMRVKRRREIDMKTEVDGSVVRVSVDAFTPDERFDNGWQSTLRVRRAGEKNEKGAAREVALRQTAPGRYAAEVPLEGFGAFLLQAEHARRGERGELEPVGVSFAHVSNPYPREYASFEPDIERLARASLAAGGTLDPEPRALFEPKGEAITHSVELYGRAVLAALAVFLLDLLVRRVRLFDRKAVARPS